MSRKITLGLLFAALFAAAPLKAAEFTYVPFADLSGWQQDNHRLALDVFARSCDDIRSTAQVPASAWQNVCNLAKARPANPRLFFESQFLPVRITEGNNSLFTAYYEPVLQGSLVRTEQFKYPLYAVPPELPRGEVWKSRAQLEDGILANRGLELVWLNDPVDALFVHIQGSSRFILPDGSTLRLGFAGRNGHPYRSVGRQMAELGLLREGQAGVEQIRDWVHLHPAAGAMALQLNPSFIFFRVVQIDASLGPIGALQYPLTAGRSIAVDPDFTPMGAPAWVMMPAGSASIARLMIAQDTGSAITGAQRADIFFGSGPEAGRLAGRIRYPGQLITLLPRAVAIRLTGRGN